MQKQKRAKPLRLLRWVVCGRTKVPQSGHSTYGQGTASRWRTSHFPTRERAREEKRFWGIYYTDISIHRVELFVGGDPDPLFQMGTTWRVE